MYDETRRIVLIRSKGTDRVSVMRNTWGSYRMRQGIPHPPWHGFPSSIARQPRGGQYRTTRLRKALGGMFTTPNFLAPTLLLYSNCGDIEHGNTAQEQGGVIVTYTVVYGRCHVPPLPQHELTIPARASETSGPTLLSARLSFLSVWFLWMA